MKDFVQQLKFLYSLASFKYENLEIGIKNKELENLHQQLEDSFSKEYQQEVKKRFSHQFGVSLSKANLTLFELKRYFILCALYQNVPMYSKEVQAMWQEMLLFTEEYDRFCQQYIGYKIHHKPESLEKVNLSQSEENEEYRKRVLFEIVYNHVFQVYEFSHHFWGSIYDNVPHDLESILQDYFKPQSNEVGKWLEQEMVEKAKNTEKMLLRK